MSNIDNIFVISALPTIAEQCAHSIIGYKSILPSSTATNESGGPVDEDPNNPFSSCLDYRDNTKYSPLTESGTITIEFRQSSVSVVDYIGIGIHNGGVANLIGELEVFSGGTWVKAAEFDGVEDNKTIMQSFAEYTTNRQRLKLTFSEKLFLGCIFLGKAWQLPRTPDLGFKPANSNSLDKVEQFYSETNQFIISRQLQGGYGATGKFSNIDFDIINTDYVTYMKHINLGRPVFFKWNSDLNENMFAQQKPPLSAPTYQSVNRGAVSFDFRGWN